MFTKDDGKSFVRITAHDNDVTFVGDDAGKPQKLPSGEFFSQYREATDEEKGNANVDHEAAALVPANDQQLRDAIETFDGDRTADGKPQMDALNAKLRADGFIPITAAKRDELLQPA